MTYTEQAIKKAIEGGFEQAHSHYADERIQALVFLDPSFWQSLAKAMDWKGESIIDMRLNWLDHWHRFIDHLTDGKDAENFFKELLN